MPFDRFDCHGNSMNPNDANDRIAFPKPVVASSNLASPTIPLDFYTQRRHFKFAALRIDDRVFLWEWDRHAYFFRTRAFLSLGIDGGDHIAISFPRLHCGVLIAIGIRGSYFCIGLDSVGPAINVITDGLRRFFPIDCNFVRLGRRNRLLASDRMQIQN